MAKIYKYKKATLCKGNTCVTVYGEAAKAIEIIAVSTAAIMAFALITRVLK